MSEEWTEWKQHEPRFKALIPFIVFIVFYLGLSLWANSFYAVPMPIAFIVASAVALLMDHKTPLHIKVDIFARGMGDTNIMLMCMIFILAGAFAAVSESMGAVKAAVAITRNLIPSNFMLAGMFLISCLISLSIGTSCGTIAALTPIAAGLIGPLGVRPELMLGAVIGGAMFGDNMSLISDTTIAATRTQDVAMQDKFLANFLMVLPAAILTLSLYLLMGHGKTSSVNIDPITWKYIVSVIPYVTILLLGICGINVMVLLFLGIVLAGVIGILTGSFSFWTMLNGCKAGVMNMSETLIVAILAGGLLSVIRWNGGITYLMQKIEHAFHSRRGCEFGIFLLVSVVNLFTANNTVAIVIAGPIAKEMGAKYSCIPKRIASILDTASCFVQGLIPYGAQILIAVGVIKSAGNITVSPVALMGTLYYQWLMAIMVLLSIAFAGRFQKNACK